MSVTDPSTHTAEEWRTEALDRYRNDLEAGRVFVYCANSNKSADRMNYRGMVGATQWGKAVQTLGKFGANYGDWGVYVASKMLAKVQPSFSDFQIVGAVADVAYEIAKDGWYDLRGATGPETGRPSSHQKTTSFSQKVVLELLIIQLGQDLTGYCPFGWAIRDMVKAENVFVPAHVFPGFQK